MKVDVYKYLYLEVSSVGKRAEVQTALDHCEPDKIPLDIGGTCCSSLHRLCYQNLRKHWGMPEDTEEELLSVVMQTILPKKDFMDRIGASCWNIPLHEPSNWQLAIEENETEKWFVDEFGITWKMPKSQGLYFDLSSTPLLQVPDEKLYDFPWPDTADPLRVKGIRATAQKILQQQDRALIVGPSVPPNLLETFTWLHGFEEGYATLISNPKRSELILEKLTHLKIALWENILDEIGDIIDVVFEGDDLGGQNGPLISPALYRKSIKPWHAKLFAAIKKKTAAKILLHSCGSIYELLPDIIETGVDAINPVHLSAKNMEPEKLKRDFGDDLTFWGGGCDPQEILPHGSPQQVKDAVKKSIDTLAPGGGFVFGAVHNIQPDVPIQNIEALLEVYDMYSIPNGAA